MQKTLDFIIAGAEVKRYHTVTTLISETVGHHSHGVAMLCLIFKPDAGRDLLFAALCHDLAEHQTGDIPSPAKREFGIGGRVDELEERLMSHVGIHMPTLSLEDKRVLKLSDIAQGALFCARELSLGNKRIRSVFDRYISYAEEMSLNGIERQIFNLIKEYGA